MGDVRALDMMIGALHCPFGTGHMGVTAENVAAEHGISRADQDAFALESQTRAARAIAEGRFRDQIVPVEVRVKREMVPFDTDEHPKATSPRRWRVCARPFRRMAASRRAMRAASTMGRRRWFWRGPMRPRRRA
jgi:hypothetical protein